MPLPFIGRLVLSAAKPNDATAHRPLPASLFVREEG